MALPNGIESTRELLEAQAHVWNHIFYYINSMSLKCAIQLGIPDAIQKHGNPITLSQLADALSIIKAKSEGLFRLMRILVRSKFFEKVKTEEGEEAYRLTRASRLLLSDEPLSMATFAVSMVDPIYVDPFHHVSEGLEVRSEKEWVKLFYAAGFKKYKISRALGLRYVIEVYPLINYVYGFE